MNAPETLAALAIPATTVRKERDGWTARTAIPLDAPYVLEISTYKGNRGLATHATRYKQDGGFKSFEVFGDFSETTLTTASRATEKSVTAQQAVALADLENIKARCAAHYVKRAAEKASRGY